MQLKIINPEANMLHTSFGISDERSDEISDSLDEIMNMIYGKGDVKLCDCMQAIAAICLTTEELVFAVFLNARWMERSPKVKLR